MSWTGHSSLGSADSLLRPSVTQALLLQASCSSSSKWGDNACFMALSGGLDEVTVYAKQLAWHGNWDFINSHHTVNKASPAEHLPGTGCAHSPAHPLSCWGRVGKGAGPWPLYGQDRPRTTVETCESVTGIKQLMGVPPWMATVMMER